jgi:hypothetical protein
LTTVPSMKTMLEPNIDVARIHGRLAGSQAQSAAALRITASSQGEEGVAELIAQ